MKIFKRTGLIIIALLIIVSQGDAQQVFNFTNNYFQQLDATHDLDLPAWGPYSRRYAGISHIPDVKTGMRFDFFVAPGYWRNKVLIPSVRHESGYYPWNITNDYKEITYRYQLEWKDKVYSDVTYYTVDTNTVLVKVSTINNTDKPQSLVMNLFANIEYPENFPLKIVNTAAGQKWYNAVDYVELGHKKQRLNDNVVYDGWLRDEVRGRQYIGGRAIAQNFGMNSGDSVIYDIDIKDDSQKGSVVFLYRAARGKNAGFIISGLGNDQQVSFAGTGDWVTLPVNFKTGASGKHKLKLVSAGTAAIELNGFVISPEENATVNITDNIKYSEADVEEINKNVILKYRDAAPYYGITWDSDNFLVRHIMHDTLEFYFKDRVPDHVSKVVRGNYQGHFVDVFIRPVAVKAKSSNVIYALVTSGTRNLVEKNLSNLSAIKQNVKPEPDRQFQNLLPGAEKYILGQRLMHATALGNIMYPIYTQNQWIKHYPPGKWWAMLYTWDAGFNAIGLNTYNKKVSAEYINTYTTRNNSQSLFVLHGTPVPVQLYALQDLYNRTQSRELLDYFYPRIKKFYDFITGKFKGSSVRPFNSGLLATWDYFYNSGGWDDYPPQWYLTPRKAQRANVAPIATTAHAIRAGKILRMMAQQLNKDDDIASYDRDIADFSKAILNNAWDKKEGYFSYVVHDQNKNPSHFFTDSASGRNFNMGLDGAYPILSGIVSPEQEKILLEKIFSPKHMWTDVGLSVVDQSAPYFRKDGYWNGAVWMPHQWFIWKTMLDINRPDLAWKIAMTGLETWKKETDESYHCYEHFQIETGRGAGWHQFGALSMPVAAWFDAYYKKGTITTGFEVMISKAVFNKDFSSLTATLSFDEATRAHERVILIAMNPGKKYKAIFNDKAVKATELNKGLWQVYLPAANTKGSLIMSPL